MHVIENISNTFIGASDFPRNLGEVTCSIEGPADRAAVADSDKAPMPSNKLRRFTIIFGAVVFIISVS